MGGIEGTESKKPTPQEVGFFFLKSTTYVWRRDPESNWDRRICNPKDLFQIKAFRLNRSFPARRPVDRVVISFLTVKPRYFFSARSRPPIQHPPTARLPRVECVQIRHYLVE